MPEPEKLLSVPPEVLTSALVKSVAVSDRVKLSASELSFEVSPLVTVVDEMLTVGAVESYVQVKADEAVFPFEAASVKRFAGTEIDVGPSAVGVKVAV